MIKGLGTSYVFAIRVGGCLLEYVMIYRWLRNFINRHIVITLANFINRHIIVISI